MLVPWMPAAGLIALKVGAAFTVKLTGPLVPPAAVTVTFEAPAMMWPQS